MDGPRAERPALCAAIMAMADTDGDGLISLAEFLQLGGVLQDVAALKAELQRPRPKKPFRQSCSCMMYCDPRSCPEDRYAQEFAEAMWQYENEMREWQDLERQRLG